MKESNKAIRPKENDNDVGRWVSGIEDEAIEIADEGEESAGKGERTMKRVMNPLLPSKVEVEEHALSHLPFRSWCPHCIRGRGKEASHLRSQSKERGLDEFHVDYCFPGDELGCKLTV